MGRSETFTELQALIAQYWASVDRIDDVQRSSASFYTEDGEMMLGTLRLRGRGEIDAFFVARNQAEIAKQRTTRHVAANLRLRSCEDSRASVAVLILVYSGCGEWPLPSLAPSAIGDFEFLCRRDSTAWLIERMSGTSVFVGSGAPSFARGERE
jgi:hypothetical protein